MWRGCGDILEMTVVFILPKGVYVELVLTLPSL